VFNLAKKRRRIPPDMFPAKLLHDKKQAYRKRNIRTDGEIIGKLVAQTGKSANDIMSGDKYWEYVWRFDEKYAKAVIRYAEGKVAPRARMEAQNPTEKARYVPPVAPPKQQGGQGGPPGPGGAMGATRSPAIKVADQSLYLTRSENRQYRLMGTLVGRLLEGKLQFIGEDGSTRVLRADRDALVSRIGSAAKEAFRLMEDMPSSVTRAMASFLDGKVENAGEMARIMSARYWASGKFDVLPMVVALEGPVKGMMLLEKVQGAESADADALRAEVGKVMYHFVRRLKSALAVEGVAVSESIVGERAREEDDEPRVLSAEEVAESLDARSLIMTTACPAAPACLRANAADRLVMVMCMFPESYEPHKLSDQEADEISRGGPELERLGNFAKLYGADDAGVMEAYFGMRGDDRLLMSHLVSSQDRRMIMDSVPEMCLQRTADGDILNDAFLDKIDVGSDHARSFVRGLMSRLSDGGEVKALEKVLLRKMMQAMDDSPDDEMISMALRSAQGFLFPLRALALCKLAEAGRGGDIQAALRSGKVGPATGAALSCPVAAIACVAMGADLMREAWDSGIRPRPADVMTYGGRGAAIKYMEANRIGWDGEQVPQASEIVSAPDDPLPLAKSLVAIGDVQSLVILLRACAKRAKRGEGRAMFYPMSFIADALRAKGSGKDADALLAGMKVEINDDRMIARRLRAVEAGLPGGATLRGANGMYEVRIEGRRARRFAASSADAVGVGLLLSQGKQPLAP
jgi:hypothetical protein